jgi:hypothetical protein
MLSVIFSPRQLVIVELVGEFGTPECTTFVIKQTVKECIHLTHTTDFIIVHGVQKSWCQNLRGTWNQSTYAANANVPQTHVQETLQPR